MKTSALLAAVVVLTIVPARADAQQMTLQIQNGLVTLDAQNVSVRQILAEWARIGGARIVNGDKVAGAVTLQLNGIPERQALDAILRGVSGYMLASRQAGSVGASEFDRILILPTSSAPRTTAAVPTSTAFAPRPMPVQPPEPVETEVVEDEDHDEADPDAAVDGSEDPDPPEQPVPNQQFQRRPPFPNPMGPQGQPFVPQGPFPGPPQPIQNDDDAPPAQPPATTPFNVPPGASSTPGVIAPVPQQQEPQTQPPRTRRPPV